MTVGLIDDEGVVVRHLGSGVLGANAPAPFQRNSLKQTISWNGKGDHDGNYVRTLVPPPANMPEEKLQGLGFVEYEAGRKALHTPDLMSTLSDDVAGALRERKPGSSVGVYPNPDGAPA